MSVPRPTTARSIAAEVLCEAELRQEFAGEILDRYLQLTERQRATDLVFGVIRNCTVIDLVIERFSSCPISQVPDRILDVLRVGVYELLYCPQTAEYAIVDEAVGYAKHVTNAKQAGFVNAVLRQTLRHIVSRQRVLEQGHPRKTLPQTPDTGCEFSIELFPDRDVSPLEYLSTVFSLPDWLVESWLAEYGSGRTTEICFASNRRPGVYLRPNVLKTTPEALAGELKARGIDCEIAGEVRMIKLRGGGDVRKLLGFEEGLFTVQDISAAEAVRILAPQQGWTILDLCAAPGTKTTQLAEATAGQAKIIATDIDNGRLEKVRENVARLGLAGCVTVVKYGSVDSWVKRVGGFDCVLVDAPCSNTGVLARRAEVRQRITRGAIEKLGRVQRELVEKAGEMVRPGGVICYSTCSIQPEENGGVIRDFVEKHANFEVRSERTMLPSCREPEQDGGFVAVLIKQVK